MVTSGVVLDPNDAPEPHALHRRPWGARRVLGEGDAVTLLTAYIVLLLGIPSRLTVGSLGAFGTPAVLLGMVAMLWWAVSRVVRTRSELLAGSPVRRAALILGLTVLASYAVAAYRPSALQEWKVAQLQVLTLASWLGIFVFTADVMPSLERLTVFVRHLTLGGGLMATFGVAQFVTGLPLTDRIQIPGLGLNSALLSLSGRDGLNRPSGTAIHAIEFGVSIAALLPLALHIALHGRDLGVVRRWFPVVAIGIATFLALSRSSVVCAAAAMLVLLPTWPPLRRKLALLVGLVGSAAVAVAVPGIFRALSGLFIGISTDTSALSRTDSYTIAFSYIARSPLIGRGFGTFLPSYRIFDNAYLLLAVEVGALGVAALLALFGAGIYVALKPRRWLPAVWRRERDLGVALAAGIASAAVGFAFFDALSFPLYSGLVFLLLGLSAAYFRLTRAGALEAPPLASVGG